MDDRPEETLRAFAFKHRGALLAIPAVALTLFGKPSAFSVTVGLPLAIGGELIRCWAVGYAGETTRGDTVAAPELVTAGPYAYVRNPLYLANAVTAAGFAIAFTGKNGSWARLLLAGGSLAVLAGVYAAIVPHEERFLRERFGEAFERYCDEVPPVVPRTQPLAGGHGRWRAETLGSAESRTFATFGAMLAALAVRALRA